MWMWHSTKWISSKCNFCLQRHNIWTFECTCVNNKNILVYRAIVHFLMVGTWTFMAVQTLHLLVKTQRCRGNFTALIHLSYVCIHFLFACKIVKVISGWLWVMLCSVCACWTPPSAKRVFLSSHLFLGVPPDTAWFYSLQWCSLTGCRSCLRHPKQNITTMMNIEKMQCGVFNKCLYTVY